MLNASPRASFRLRARVWIYPGPGGWHFLTLSGKRSAALRALFADGARPFGSIAVHVTIGATRWRTSLFPDTKAGAYLLAIKANVRKREGIHEGMTVTATVDVI